MDDDNYYDDIKKLYCFYTSENAPECVRDTVCEDDSFFDDIAKIYSSFDTGNEKCLERPSVRSNTNSLPVMPIQLPTVAPPVPNRQIAKPRKSPIIGKEKNRYSRDESMSLPPSAPENGIEVTMLLGPSLTQSYGSRIAPGDGVVAEDGNIPGTDQAGSNEDILRTARPTMCAPPDSPQRRSGVTGKSLESLPASPDSSKSANSVSFLPASPRNSRRPGLGEYRKQLRDACQTAAADTTTTSITIVTTSSPATDVTDAEVSDASIIPPPIPSTSSPPAISDTVSKALSSDSLTTSLWKSKTLPPNSPVKSKRATSPDDPPLIPRHRVLEIPNFYPSQESPEIISEEKNREKEREHAINKILGVTQEEVIAKEKERQYAKRLGASTEDITSGLIKPQWKIEDEVPRPRMPEKAKRMLQPMSNEDLHASPESAIQKFIREKRPHANLPAISLLMMPEDQYIRIEGPSPHTYLWSPLYGTDIYGESISNYPFKSMLKRDGGVVIDKIAHQGDPICDQFCVDRYCNRIMFALADGCNWGVKPRNAAFNASRRICTEQTNQPNPRELHSQCISGWFPSGTTSGTDPRYSDIGTTTMIAGGLFELPQNKWGFIAAGVGDCKAFCFSIEDDGIGVEEITLDTTISVRQDAKDPGGRLGPQLQGGHPDLRNFTCWFKQMKENDFVLICSDGVHDNLDPQTLGLDPKDVGLPDDNTWDELCDKQPEKVATRKTDFAYSKLLEFCKKATKRGEIRMQDLTDIVIKFCKESTKASREFMEQNPNSPLPEDYKQFPGKLDHVSCICIRAQRHKQKTPQVYAQYAMAFSRRIGGYAFIGAKLTDWLIKEILMSKEVAEYTGQCLLGFRYILPSAANAKKKDMFFWEGAFNETGHYEINEFFRVQKQAFSFFDR